MKSLSPESGINRSEALLTRLQATPSPAQPIKNIRCNLAMYVHSLAVADLRNSILWRYTRQLCYYVTGPWVAVKKSMSLLFCISHSRFPRLPMCVGDKDRGEKDRVQYFAEPATALAIQMYHHSPYQLIILNLKIREREMDVL